MSNSIYDYIYKQTFMEFAQNQKHYNCRFYYNTIIFAMTELNNSGV